MQFYKAIFASLLSFSAFATPQDEIAHLIDYVKNTQCQYERNGTMHTGAEAVEHIQKKYDYFAKRIKTAEDFIAFSAAKSTISRKPYLVHCAGNQPIKSQDWLLEELRHLRQTK